VIRTLRLLRSFGVLVALSVTAPSLSAQAADIRWHRQVSPAPGIATFAGVLPYASEITAGCRGNNFCPVAPPTREQTAAFLSRRSGSTGPTERPRAAAERP
jgi:hypothetical protein